MDSFTVKVEEMIARELRHARTWLIAVALLSFVQQILFAYNLPPKLASKHQLFTLVAWGQLAVFFGIWLLSYWKPKLSLILALIAFWIMQIFVMLSGTLDSVISPGAVIFRLAFTLALIGGISAAHRAEEMARNREPTPDPDAVAPSAAT